MQINWESWIENGGEPKWKGLRQAIHITLLSISKCGSLKDSMMLKGGILMALCYESSRYTKDIDLSQKERYQKGDEEKLLGELKLAMQEAVQEVEYGLDCRVQSSELKPANQTNPTFPTIKVKVGYAYNHDRKNHLRLSKGYAATIIEIDFSFNETTKSAEEFSISDGQTLLRYSLADLIAEKYRALLQQELRNRYRGQDLYDLALLLRQIPHQLAPIKTEILEALLASSQSKGLSITKESMNEGKIKDMTKKEYDLLNSSVDEGTLEAFDFAYQKVNTFYKSLPWS